MTAIREASISCDVCDRCLRVQARTVREGRIQAERQGWLYDRNGGPITDTCYDCHGISMPEVDRARARAAEEGRESIASLSALDLAELAFLDGKGK